MGEIQTQRFSNGDLLDVPDFAHIGTLDGSLVVATPEGTAYYGPNGSSYADANGRPTEHPTYQRKVQ